MTKPLTPAELTAIRARVDVATEGPWEHIDYRNQVIQRSTYKTVVDGPVAGGPWKDLAFVAAARTDVPALLDEVARLRGVVKTLLPLVKEAEITWPNDECRMGYCMAEHCGASFRDSGEPDAPHSPDCPRAAAIRLAEEALGD